MAALTTLPILIERGAHGPTVLKAFAVVVLASFPGWLFIRFMAFRAGALWTEFVLNLHRLGMDDHQNLPRPPEGSPYFARWSGQGGETLVCPASVYQQKFEAYYGHPVGPEHPENPPINLKSLPPVLVATLVLAAGWAAVLARDPLFSEDLVLPVDSLRFGFMGAYVFIVQMLIRRFFQSDLKPSSYYGTVARVVTVLVVVLVVHYTRPGADEWTKQAEVATAFLIGFFPLLGMQILQKAVSTMFRRWVPTLRTPYPLSDLDGLNIWYEARLLEEGIEDLQNLVTGNLVDILLHTRVPVERLVDWIDQAALQLLVDPPSGDSESLRPSTDRCTLRRFGVRTATDLETMFVPAARLVQRPARSPILDLDHDSFRSGMSTLLNDPKIPGPNVTEALLRNFANVPNLIHVRHWRNVVCSTADAR